MGNKKITQAEFEFATSKPPDQDVHAWDWVTDNIHTCERTLRWGDIQLRLLSSFLAHGDEISDNRVLDVICNVDVYDADGHRIPALWSPRLDLIKLLPKQCREIDFDAIRESFFGEE